MIKVALILLSLGIGLVACAIRLDQHSQVDDFGGPFLLLIIGAVMVAVALLMLVGYALYVAFGS